MNARSDTPSGEADQDYGRLRRALVQLCAQKAYIEAILRLEASDLPVDEVTELWEYLERQLAETGEERLAATVRARLAQAGRYTPQMALADAREALGKGQPARAARILQAAFGADDLPAPAARMLAQALTQTAHPQAVDGLRALADNDSDMALMTVDALRGQERLHEAQDRCRSAAERFPSDARFRVRLARIAAALNRWDEALAGWMALAQDPNADRATSLGNAVRLLIRLERTGQAADCFAEFLHAEPSLPDLVQVARALGLEEVASSAIQQAVLAGAPPLPEWPALAEQLLDTGRLGEALWLDGEGLPVGKTAQEALSTARRLLPERVSQIDSWRAAQQLTSPEALLPFPPWFGLRRPAPDRPLNQLRVLLVNAGLGSGGAERQFVMLVRALLRAGLRADQIDVALFSLSADRGRAHFLADLQATGVTLHDLQTRTRTHLAAEPDFRDRMQLLPSPLRQDVAALDDLVGTLRPDILHGWQDRASLAAGFVGAHHGTGRIVLSARNMQPALRDRHNRVDDRPLYRALCSLPNVSLSANAAAAARDYEAWLELAPGSVATINNALDFDRFSLRPHQTGSEVVTIVGVFRLAANKQPLLWLDTVRRLQRMSTKRIVPRMVGSGPLAEQVLSHAKAIGLEDLTLDGGLSDPSEIYGEADVILLMSRIEGTPNVLLEAQAMGIAAAACDVGGVAEALMPQGPAAGLLLPPSPSPEDAAQRIAEWLPQALEAPRHLRADYVRARFSPETLGQRTLTLYTAQEHSDG
ncbi:glycosyltransferase [Tropicibacter naphthalenivorans]|uniref:Vi polysaccharide biosynthesis protein TviE n=1 Tax=Tropicibacter naphthalenivorans TaxID=441103 RepID=A0A0P1H2G7_9RHOB|nr:glycosyltransferase [Tropicibacter naphthalenivorans]CUH82684.1 Vi polysaccharide biosynthesis protein TviE [Tropicibacter naphthalenivorans]SMD11158.1 Glycosyltransferase involved in cell wall bisynthesis [Tropicibacter naphthalenivorans]